jgi:peptide/nickel transport system permease protein
VPEADAGPTFQEVQPKQAEWKKVFAIFFRRKVAVIGLAIIFLMIIMAICAPLIVPYDPYEPDTPNRLAPPSREHWLGTDSVGRDSLSRIIYASRTSLMVGLGAVGISAVIGQTLGLIAGYFGGWVFNVIMRVIDSMMAIPQLVLALVISTILGGGLENVIIALGVGGIPVHCRMMCGQAMTVKENEYILAARMIGASNKWMMLRHIFPNSFPPLLVTITIGLGATILAEAGLSFLGVGINPPACAWGSLIFDGYRFLRTNPVLSFAPGIALMLVVFGFNMMGDGLRDALDPRLRGTI